MTSRQIRILIPGLCQKNILAHKLSHFIPALSYSSCLPHILASFSIDIFPLFHGLSNGKIRILSLSHPFLTSNYSIISIYSKFSPIHFNPTELFIPFIKNYIHNNSLSLFPCTQVIVDLSFLISPLPHFHTLKQLQAGFHAAFLHIQVVNLISSSN